MMDKSNYASKTIGIVSERMLAVSWNIATEPELYRELASNPYTPKALKIVLERFPDVNTADIVKAVVLAEPEGKYDRDFSQLSKNRQEEELCKQKSISVEINKRLVSYFKKHTKDLRQLPKEIVYEGLSKLVFETKDIKEIEDRFSQNQRRDFKLTIINFIEDALGFVQKGLPLNLAMATLTLLLIFFATQRQTPAIVKNSEANTQVLAANVQNSVQGFPVRLIIPSINVDAAIEYVGVTSEGIMGVSMNISDVAWFGLGPKPGETGSAVIAGHFDGINGEDTVFTNLNKLKKGDELFVENDKGEVIAFVVQGSGIYDPGYADDVFSRNDGSYLNLITCDGVWDGSKKSFSKRLVVFADIVN